MTRITFKFIALIAALNLGILIGACGTIIAQNTALTIEVPELAAPVLGGALIMFGFLILLFVILKGRVFPHDWPGRGA